VVSSSVVGTVPVSATFTHVRMVASNFQSPSTLVVFPIEATGNATPQAVISGSNTTLQNVRSVVVAGGEIFAVDDSAHAIAVFPTTAIGNVAPIRRITGPTTGLGNGLMLNAAVLGGELYVPQTDGTISVFPQNADGDVAPTRVISGLGFISYLAISNGEIYVTGDHQIEVLPVDASGPVAPTRVIRGSGHRIECADRAPGDQRQPVRVGLRAGRDPRLRTNRQRQHRAGARPHRHGDQARAAVAARPVQWRSLRRRRQRARPHSIVRDPGLLGDGLGQHATQARDQRNIHVAGHRARPVHLSVIGSMAER
jgi:hypothetical protein